MCVPRSPARAYQLAHIMYNMPNRWLRRTTSKGIKTEPMGGVRRQLRDLGWKCAPYLTVTGTHIFRKPWSIVTTREGKITPTRPPLKKRPTNHQEKNSNSNASLHTETQRWALTGWYCQEWRIILWSLVCVEKRSCSGQEKTPQRG